MDKTEVYCPRCLDDVAVDIPWGNVRCPKCGLSGFWEEACLPDYSDCWPVVEWDDF